MHIFIATLIFCLAATGVQAKSYPGADAATKAAAEAYEKSLREGRGNNIQPPAEAPKETQRLIVDNDPKSAPLSPQDKEDVRRIEAYLDELKSISADFLQVDDQGNMMRGTIEIKRPGRMRVTYAPPSKDFIVADGSMVHIWDSSLKSQTNVPQSASLANFILRKNVKLSGDVTVTKFERFPNKLEVTLIQSDDPGLGTLTLIFEDKPLLLRQWRVIDAQGRMTGVNLENERSGVDFPSNTFTFVPPSFGKGGKAN
ncbi:MAG: outer membrane lipoprotein carrier protein LolA [Bdellovibrionales bacterium]